MSDYTFHEAVAAIDRATITGLVFPRALRDNHPVSRLLCLDWRNTTDRDAWLDYFGAHIEGIVAWARDWHGWRVLLTAHFPNDLDPATVGTEQRHGSPPAVADVCIEASARRIHGMHRAAALDLAPTVSAALTPDAPITRPCGQQTRHETHGQHTRHVGAYTRSCGGWENEATVQTATVPR